METIVDRKIDWRGTDISYRVEKHHPHTWRSYVAGELVATGVSHEEVRKAAGRCMKHNPDHYIKAQEKLDAD
jgi:hypothetical protein